MATHPQCQSQSRPQWLTWRNAPPPGRRLEALTGGALLLPHQPSWAPAQTTCPWAHHEPGRCCNQTHTSVSHHPNPLTGTCVTGSQPSMWHLFCLPATTLTSLQPAAVGLLAAFYKICTGGALILIDLKKYEINWWCSFNTDYITVNCSNELIIEYCTPKMHTKIANLVYYKTLKELPW